jgi:F-type H+-transporting ATPase subunit gamma
LATQQEIKSRISSVKNVHKITRAMEMVAAARLRRAEQRIEQLRPYADAIRRMTRRVVEASDQMPDIPLLQEHDSDNRVGIVVVTGDRGLAGAFNSQIIRAGTGRARELERDGKEVLWFASGKRGESSLGFRGIDLAGSWTGFTDRPAYSDAREIAEGLITAYSDDKLDRAEIFYNGYVSAMTQHVTQEVLLPLQQAELLGEEDDSDDEQSSDGSDGQGSGEGDSADHSRSLWIYEPSPEQILERLAPDYVEITIYRALLESTASEHGSRMTAMRNASNNASEMIDDLTLEANRQRQAEITQQLMEIVAGAEGI